MNDGIPILTFFYYICFHCFHFYFEGSDWQIEFQTYDGIFLVIVFTINALLFAFQLPVSNK